MSDEVTTGQGAPATGGTEGVSQPAQDPAPAPGAQTPPAGGDAAQAYQAQLEELRKIQAGQDRRIQQLTQELTTRQQERDTLATQLEELQGQASTTTEELDTLRQRANAADAEKADLEAQVTAAQAEADRIKLVAAKYPSLAPLIDAGALPKADTLEDFDAKLGELAQAFNTQASVQFQQMAQGVKPPASPPSGGTASPGQIHQDMLAAVRAGDMAKYNELKEQWYAAQAAQSS